MTREQLDAIRARVTASLHFGGCCVLTVWPDITALLAEVERLTAEVEMLRGVGCMEDGDGPCGACRKCAFKRGVSVMREAAVLASRENIGCRHMVCHTCESPAAVIRALPDPEDTE